ncbi:MAG TPA: metal-dependent phosphohydrolase [Clostridia bacterium]|nr:metal-dependent phosphohydrolase [Clostridia bacterium]
MDEQLRMNILTELNKVDRPGMNDLVEFLESSDYFTAPASTKYHSSHECGLAEHSWHVLKGLRRKVAGFKLDVPEDSQTICGLLHDICKVKTYKKEQKWRKDDKGKWESYEVYVTDDQFPAGHGEKSVIILQKYIKLTDQEIMMIRWHMAGFEPSENYKYYNGAMDKYPEIVALIAADIESTYLLEKKGSDEG